MKKNFQFPISNFQFSEKSGFTPLEIPTQGNLVKLRNKKFLTGFTLIEMIVYLAVFIVILGILTTFALWAIESGTKAKLDSEVLNNGRRALEILVYEIKKSKSVYTPTSIFDANPGQLSLEQTTDNPSNETANFIDFFRCGQLLCLKREGANPIALTNSEVILTNLKFTQLLNSATSPSIQINLSLESARNISSRIQSKSQINLTTTANLNAY